MEPTIEERRSSPRVIFRTPLRYQIRGTPEFSDTITENISVGGIGFINSKFVAPRTLIMLEIGVLSRILKLIGRIAWAASLPHSARYRLGIEFVDLGLQDKSYLRDFVDMQTGRL